MENTELEGSEDKKFWEELIVHFLSYDRDRIGNDSPIQIFYCCVCVLQR
jgi:hypothetical protein